MNPEGVGGRFQLLLVPEELLRRCSLRESVRNESSEGFTDPDPNWFVCFLLTQCGVVEGEISQVSGVLRQDEQAPGVAVPHQGTSGTVLQHAVLDDLDTHGMRTH